MAWARRLTMVGAGAVLVGGLVWALWPQPAAVDLAQVSRGPMQVTIAAEGITRVREPYAIAAPISGMVERSPVHVGDPVVEGETVLAVIRPAEPGLMDARSRAQAEAAVTEAEAALALSETNFRRAVSGLSNAQIALERARALAAAGTISQRAREDAEHGFTAASQALAAARSERDLQSATLARARAQLLTSADFPDSGGALSILAPHSGTVLNIADLSSRPVVAGAALLSIGDLRDLEIEIDLLSSDAVRVEVDAPALVERWGGDNVLEAVVRRIEPAAFTRVSALGIEEQRVRLVLDFTQGAETRPGVGRPVSRLCARGHLAKRRRVASAAERAVSACGGLGGIPRD
ncbi:HlyD family efflux transporter periplasmic adaptor subunit [Pararhodobacter sp.]|uniref:HlyD family efflux transporter periplasmic adaptor subunit n=1 Tax=Pararhodobacter sp. TaxID=2127056 RepID=UPI002AFFD8B6|nr:HlyD family efflux transporter periplasmic adaptor subunit [Pararhodobacter sp.]